MQNDKAELIRLRYKYRRLIMQGELKLPLEGAVKLIGPDCAYHLYSSLGNGAQLKKETQDEEKSRNKKK